MPLSIEERIDLETWEVLQQIKQDFILTPEDQYVPYEVVDREANKQYPSKDNQIKIIEKLEHQKIVEVKKRYYLTLSIVWQGRKPQGFVLNIIEDKFNEIFEAYGKKYSDHEAYKKDRRDEFYLTKEGDDFYYKGGLLNLSKKGDPYKVFCALYSILPEGGEIGYEQIEKEIRSRVPKTKKYLKSQIRKFLLTNLTDRSNGFLRYAKIPETEDSGKPLLSSLRGEGIAFNNRKG